MSATTTGLGFEGQRRTLRFSVPGPQLGLALQVLGITLGFALLFLGNSYAAFGSLFGSAIDVAPSAFGADILAQAGYYGSVSAALLLGYGLAVVAVCGSYVHRLVGPTVALERQVRALKSGDFTARVALRNGDVVHGNLARLLNDLGEQLQREERAAMRRALERADTA